MKNWAPVVVLAFCIPAAGAATDVAPAHRTPEYLSAEVAAIWKHSVAAEKEHDYLEAARLREQILEMHPDQVHVLWRVARDLMRGAESFAAAQPERTIEIVKRAGAHAKAGRRADPACAECCFYDFAAVAREASAADLIGSFRLAREMKPILDQCLANPATWRDSDWHTEEAALYYGASQFYRLTPNSPVVSWVIGFQGNSAEALRLARKADGVAPDRIDLRTELGTALLCHGAREDDSELKREGVAVLGDTVTLDRRFPTDSEDRERAAWLIENPTEACGAGRNLKLN